MVPGDQLDTYIIDICNDDEFFLVLKVLLIL
jgi:hypothetical protein